jgi:hypothetical protein
MVKETFKKINERAHKIAHFSGIKRHAHEQHQLTLRRLILLACGVSLIIVVVSSMMFYRDPRSKYDLVRPGRRVLPQEFRAPESSAKGQEKTAEEVKLSIQKVQKDLEGLKIYGKFKDDGLGNGKVLQDYLDNPVVE